MIWLALSFLIVVAFVVSWYHTQLFAAVHERINDVEQMLAKHHDATAKELNGGVVVRGVLAGVNLAPQVPQVPASPRPISTDHLDVPLVVPAAPTAPTSETPNTDPRFAGTTYTQSQLAILNAAVDPDTGLIPAAFANTAVFSDGSRGQLPDGLKALPIFAADIAEQTYCFFISTAGITKVRTSAPPVTPLVTTAPLL